MRCYVTKTDCQHDSGAPVVRPHIFFIPLRILESFLSDPVFVWTHVGHAKQYNRKNVSVEKVEEKNFRKRPVLLFIVILNEKYLQFFYLLKPMWQLDQHKNFTQIEKLKVRISSRVKQHYQEVNQIDSQTFSSVIFSYLT